MSRSGKVLAEMYRKNIGENATKEQDLMATYFSDYAESLPVWEDNPTAFHRAFRQQDIFGEGWRDMITWSIMSGNACNVIWPTLEEFYNGQQ